MKNETTTKSQGVLASVRRALAEMNRGPRRLVEITAEFDESAGDPKL